ncbi:carbohydrate ABC transporter permease [Paenibacillus planticolens]|uniref:ABC transporter permease subunit n=1 Tax=Paenibacillus planticolens TaxID=2654976 RepID=A0ABX1ZEY9_9BACL|nr:sugar ABC transporter permease [Paenibacillus planticolens]NOU98665.1 ABC transporter permease subunit [Paenibacillus planticolens]
MHTLKRVRLAIFLGILPSLVIYLGIAVLPIAISFYYSFLNWDGFSPAVFVGLDNFIEIVKDIVFWSAVKNNIIMMGASLIFQIPLGLLLALLLNRPLKGIKIFRTIGFFPVVISSVIVSLTWGMLYNTEYGFINGILSAVGLDAWQHNWLGDPNWAMVSLCITYIWQNCGFFMVIFLSALQGVSNEVIEAAEMDGATGLKRVLFVTLPMIRDTLWVTVIFSISNSFRVFDLIYVMTAGGPAHNTEVMTIYMYNNSFTSLRFGYGSAVSIFILAFSLIVIYVANKFTNKDN